MKYFSQHLYINLFSLVLLFYFGCAQFRGPKYPEIIYNNKQPLISVKYEYGEVQIILPLEYDGIIPDNILFKVFAKADTMNPIISILQEKPNEFRTTLPQGSLDVNDKTNLIKIIPQDENFDPVSVRFTGIGFGRIVLPVKVIRAGQLIISGKTFLKNNRSIIPKVQVSVQNFDDVIFNTFSNDSGFYQIAIPGESKFAEDLKIVAGKNLILKPFSEKLDFKNSRKLKINILLGPSKKMRGPLYITNKENVQFKKGPDIGAETLFLLNKGEVISVDRITPGAYHGYIEVEIDDGENIIMEGWANRVDLKELNMNFIQKVK
tara:strand:+ start:836 stop:1795 length:960 start_codon:yes stop_codon:yes gene_type:complete